MYFEKIDTTNFKMFNSNIINEMRNMSILMILTLAIINGAICGQSQASSSSDKSAGVQSTTSAPKLTTNQASSQGTPYGTNLKSVTPTTMTTSANSASGDQRQATNQASSVDIYHGLHPFADDSLWRIPVAFGRDLNEGSSDQLSSKSSATRPSGSTLVGSGSTSSLLRDATDFEGSDEADDDDDYSRAQSSQLPQASHSAPDLKAAAGYHYPSHGGHYGHGDHYSGGGHHYGGHHGSPDYYGGKYFQYASVPYPYTWEFGYRRGNPYHTIERYEHGKGPHFKTKVKWSDKNGGYGVHVWDYNHDDHYSHHYGGGSHYDSHSPSHYAGGNHYGSHYGGHGHH